MRRRRVHLHRARGEVHVGEDALHAAPDEPTDDGRGTRTPCSESTTGLVGLGRLSDRRRFVAHRTRNAAPHRRRYLRGPGNLVDHPILLDSNRQSGKEQAGGYRWSIQVYGIGT